MEEVVRHPAAHTKPGGYVVVGNFAFPNGNFLLQMIEYYTLLSYESLLVRSGAETGLR